MTIPFGVGSEFRPLDDLEKKKGFCARYGLARPFFLYVGAKRFNKNIMILLKGYAAFRLRGEIDMVFVGDDDDFGSREREFIASSLSEGSVRNLRILSQKELVIAYNSALALIFPSFREGIGLPVLEAMACGIPVVASNATSLPEVGGDAALYFDPQDADELAHVLETIIQSDIRRNLSEKGRIRARQFT